MVAEGHGLGDCNENHFNTDDQVKNSVASVPGKQIHRAENLEHAALPEGKEQNGLDGKELVKGAKGCQTLLRRLVEEHEEVEGERHAQVVDKGEPGEPTVQVVGPIAEHVMIVEDDGQNGGDGLDQDELEHALLHSTVENSDRESKRKLGLLIDYAYDLGCKEQRDLSSAERESYLKSRTYLSVWSGLSLSRGHGCLIRLLNSKCTIN